MKKSQKIILIISIVILSIVAVFFVINKNVFAAKKNYNTHEKKLEKLIISDYSIDQSYTNLVNTCKDYMKEYKKSIDEKNMLNINKIDKSLEEKEKSLEKYDESIITDLSNDLNDLQNTKSLYPYETKKIDDVESKVNNLIKSGDYNSAYKKCSSILFSFRKISDLSNFGNLQYDFSEFPKVKLYLDSTKLEEILGYSINGTKFKIIEKIGDNYEEVKINEFGTTSQDGRVNIDLLADVSASMNPYFNDVKTATTNFVQNVDMTKNKVGLMSFGDSANRIYGFTNDQNAILNGINSLQLQNMTCLYDALSISLSNINTQSGAKCIVAFTDGYDTKSYYNYNSVLDLAKSYNIPIYLIGIGELSPEYEEILTNISEVTNAYYRNINESNIQQEMSQIYGDISKRQNTLYYIDYTDKNKNKSEKRELYLEYNDGNTIIRNKIKDTVEIPNNELYKDGKKAAVASFIRESNIKYFESMNKRDISFVKDFYDESESGQKLLLEAQSNLNKYTKENTTLEFFNYSINKVEIVNNNTYKVSYSQEYKNSSPNREPIYYHASATDTVIEKNGRFYITEFDGPEPQKLDSAKFKLND
ncbi:vWA domain-containing protein [Intestinibacter bartlettii]|uniref:von Willebrand factor type A domain protein n=1 Tax=Intestinibacter bartlettii CAG:1329 TaxID=1263063 RepID=R5XPG4_9FIRM|nr:vWA domain-containing protein [Intestinibacter bartlettii]CDA10681.1 von Willebrand factor type A domain protein [Intestinibacter bartlettii CAG:1329]